MSILMKVSGEAVTYLAQKSSASPELDELLQQQVLTSSNDAFHILSKNLPSIVQSSIDRAPTPNSTASPEMLVKLQQKLAEIEGELMEKDQEMLKQEEQLLQLTNQVSELQETEENQKNQLK